MSMLGDTPAGSRLQRLWAASASLVTAYWRITEMGRRAAMAAVMERAHQKHWGMAVGGPLAGQHIESDVDQHTYLKEGKPGDGTVYVWRDLRDMVLQHPEPLAGHGIWVPKGKRPGYAVEELQRVYMLTRGGCRMIPPYPLCWPDGLRRTPSRTNNPNFKTTRIQAMENVEKALGALARDSGLHVSEISITSNVAGIRGGEPGDPGVAVWFKWDGDMRAIAIDRYHKVEWNLQAIFHLIEADRTKIRHGGLQMVRAAYSGMMLALAAPGAKKSWRDVFKAVVPIIEKSPASAASDIIRGAYKSAARARSGDDAAMQELNVARDEALKELGDG